MSEPAEVRVANQILKRQSDLK